MFLRQQNLRQVLKCRIEIQNWCFSDKPVCQVSSTVAIGVSRRRVSKVSNLYFSLYSVFVPTFVICISPAFSVEIVRGCVSNVSFKELLEFHHTGPATACNLISCIQFFLFCLKLENYYLCQVTCGNKAFPKPSSFRWVLNTTEDMATLKQKSE